MSGRGNMLATLLGGAVKIHHTFYHEILLLLQYFNGCAERYIIVAALKLRF